MSGVNYSYKGSDFICQFQKQNLRSDQAFRRRTGFLNSKLVVKLLKQDFWLMGKDCIIDSYRGAFFIRTLRNQISLNDKKAAKYQISLQQKNKLGLSAKILKTYSRKQKRLMNSCELQRLDQELINLGICCKPSIIKIIISLYRCYYILKLKKNNGMKLKDIAHQLNCSFNTISSLWRRIRHSNGHLLVKLYDKVNSLILKEQFLKVLFSKLDGNNIGGKVTLKEMYIKIREHYIYENNITFTSFYKSFIAEGFRFRSIRYEPKPQNVVNDYLLQDFLHVYIHFLVHSNQFIIVYLDESSICPSNFKKKQWVRKKQQSIIQSKIKYEKIMMLGAMTSGRLVGFKILNCNFSNIIFTHFVQETVCKLLSSNAETRQIVLFLDNCSSHRGKDLAEFCTNNNIILFYNLPRRCELNPIEFLWEFIKRPLRSLVTYEK